MIDIHIKIPNGPTLDIPKTDNSTTSSTPNVKDLSPPYHEGPTTMSVPETKKELESQRLTKEPKEDGSP